MRVEDPVLLEVHVVAELLEVFIRKWTPRYAATVEGPVRELLESLTEESREIHETLQEAVSIWVAAEGGKVRMGEQAMSLARHEFLENLVLFNGTCVHVLERAAEHAPSPGARERLRATAARLAEHARAIQEFLERGEGA